MFYPILIYLTLCHDRIFLARQDGSLHTLGSVLALFSVTKGSSEWKCGHRCAEKIPFKGDQHS